MANVSSDESIVEQLQNNESLDVLLGYDGGGSLVYHKRNSNYVFYKYEYEHEYPIQICRENLVTYTHRKITFRNAERKLHVCFDKHVCSDEFFELLRAIVDNSFELPLIHHYLGDVFVFK